MTTTGNRNETRMTTILLVEDDINLREIYAARLEAEDYKVVVASDGEEALAKSIKEKPALILLDVMMPKISGFDVLDIIRSTPETRSVKVIMLTALSQSSDKARGERLGVNKYLVKSQITLEDVVDSVKNILNESQQSGKTKTKSTNEPSESEQIEAAVASLSSEQANTSINSKREYIKPSEENQDSTEDSED